MFIKPELICFYGIKSVHKRKKKIWKTILLYITFITQIEFNATNCTDQHFGGGCSKMVVKMKILKG